VKLVTSFQWMVKLWKVWPQLMKVLLLVKAHLLFVKLVAIKVQVTGGTKVLSDKIQVRVTTEAGESFLDKMIALVEGASDKKHPMKLP
jgi:hypothetical protein